jgi:hypothetical protein
MATVALRTSFRLCGLLCRLASLRILGASTGVLFTTTVIVRAATLVGLTTLLATGVWNCNCFAD